MKEAVYETRVMFANILIKINFILFGIFLLRILILFIIIYESFERNRVYIIDSISIGFIIWIRSQFCLNPILRYYD